ncbi:MAG TPA: YafY family protein [Chthonomonadaceae bacterium]|nr:YafY family protein [Chthonomonadaceae bacterium]
MYHPTTRVLALLELLQAQGRLSGPELAECLEVDIRTVRHYVALLQEMGIPVETLRGRYGGYRLLPGYKLPPMMFTEGEALALMLGLQAAERLGLTVAAPAAVGARAKLERVLPLAVREKVQATLQVLVIEEAPPYTPPMCGVVVTLSMAAQQQRQVEIRYRSWQKEETVRRIAPYGVVNYQGRWFAVGYCYLRNEMRIFRLDRVISAELQPETFERPADFDSLAYVVHSLAMTPGTWEIEVLLKTSLTQARQCLSASLGILEEVPEGVVLRCWVQSLGWFAHLLAGLEWECVIRQPSELREEMRALADRAIVLGMMR